MLNIINIQSFLFDSSLVCKSRRKSTKALRSHSTSVKPTASPSHARRYRSTRRQWHDIEPTGGGQELTPEYEHIKYTAKPREISSPSFITKAVGWLSHVCPSFASASIHPACHLNGRSPSARASNPNIFPHGLHFSCLLKSLNFYSYCATATEKLVTCVREMIEEKNHICNVFNISTPFPHVNNASDSRDSNLICLLLRDLKRDLRMCLEIQGITFWQSRFRAKILSMNKKGLFWSDHKLIIAVRLFLAVENKSLCTGFQRILIQYEREMDCLFLVMSVLWRSHEIP